ncbi:MAG: isoaspartyl peptidase/L-asparaginase [Planctomycetales bacterium]|nr:isoaspartyl peptidase/L-asparaginase [Planctomycetales bacterium]
MRLERMATGRAIEWGVVAGVIWAGHVVSGVVATAVENSSGNWAIVVHGGAGSSPAKFSRNENESRYASLQQVLRKGKEILEAGGSSLDAVEMAIRMLEDDPQFNAGKGAVFNAAGSHELDASIMDGRTGQGGAVAGVKTVRNPISLARLVMTNTRHVLLASDGADAFAREMNIPATPQNYFHTESARREWEAARQRRQSEGNQSDFGVPPFRWRAEESASVHYGTVGCVALDSQGNLAAGTSTGGLTNKLYGRIGDSPILGAGTFADNATCAVSATGIGELFIRGALAHDVSAQMRYAQKGLPAALHDVIHNQLRPNTGGMIAVDKNGVIAVEFNTQGMASGAADSHGRWEIDWDVTQSRIADPTEQP